MAADLETTLQRLGLARAGELQASLGVSQATVSRALAALGDRVVRVGRARSARYALARSIGPLGSRWPLFSIDGDGQPRQLGHLVALAAGRTWFEGAEDSSLFAEGGEAPGLFSGLPWYLADLWPQGFIGRLFARAHAERLGAPRDLALWSDANVLAALLQEGDDLVGDLVLGEAMLERVQRRRLEGGAAAIEPGKRARRYPALAQLVLAGEPAGSSPGGEQPKFTSRTRDADGRLRHVLVKFTDNTDTPARARWSDLLRAEHHAGASLRAHGIAAARSENVEGDGRTFLEVERFDRRGAHGRSGTVTLAALDDALYGARDDWRRSASRLARDGWISDDDARLISVLHWFGGLIANNDMHFGNVSFMRGFGRPLALAPVYDMLPMQYQPAATGEIVARVYAPPLPPPGDVAEWHGASVAATDFWSRVASDRSISPEFREIATANGERLARARTQISPRAAS